MSTHPDRLVLLDGIRGELDRLNALRLDCDLNWEERVRYRRLASLELRMLGRERLDEAASGRLLLR